MSWPPPMLEARLHSALLMRLCQPPVVAAHQLKEFAATVLDPEGFCGLRGLSHISNMLVHPAQETHLASLPTEVILLLFTKYSDFISVLSPGSAMGIPELTGINNHAIDQSESKQTLYGPIYNLGPVELETLKTYIKTWPMDMSGLPSHQPGFWPRICCKKGTSLRTDAHCPRSAKPLIAWAVSDVVFHPVGSDERIPSEERSWRQQIEDSLPDS